MAHPELVASVKQIVTLLRAGKLEDAHKAYAALFASPAFATYPPEDQRQTLKFMVHAKGLPAFPSETILDAFRKAMPPLKALIAAEERPEDLELLGLCQFKVGDLNAAKVTFQRGLDLERARDPQSPLCGQFMKHVASV